MGSRARSRRGAQPPPPPTSAPAPPAVVDSVVARGGGRVEERRRHERRRDARRDTLVLKGYGRGGPRAGRADAAAPRSYEIASLTKQFTPRRSCSSRAGEGVARRAGDALPAELPVRRGARGDGGAGCSTTRRGSAATPRSPSSRRSRRALLAARHAGGAVRVQAVRTSSGAAQVVQQLRYFPARPHHREGHGRSYAEYVQEHLFARARGWPTRATATRARCASGARAATTSCARGCARRLHRPHLALRGVVAVQHGRRPGAVDAALHGGRILGAAAYRELLRRGASTTARAALRQGAGGERIGVGHAWVQHGGDIPGFASFLAWLPRDSMRSRC
jgi:hypothetical protein